MKLFSVTVEVKLVVLAEDSINACMVAEDYAMDAARDSGFEADWATEIQGLEDLPAGWKGAELPYGAEDDKSIAQILAEAPPPAVRDTFTIDMFEVLQ